MAKIALITGANRGLGLATARTLARSGVTTIVAARDAAEAEQAATELRSEGLDTGSVQLDVNSPASARAAAQSPAPAVTPGRRAPTPPCSVNELPSPVVV